jgi:hypothetical protein
MVLDLEGSRRVFAFDSRVREVGVLAVIEEMIESPRDEEPFGDLPRSVRRSRTPIAPHPPHNRHIVRPESQGFHQGRCRDFAANFRVDAVFDLDGIPAWENAVELRRGAAGRLRLVAALDVGAYRWRKDGPRRCARHEDPRARQRLGPQPPRVGADRGSGHVIAVVREMADRERHSDGH